MTPPYTPRTKIVCTLGPASATLNGIRALVEAGMNVARLNFSHGTREEHRETIRMVRSAAADLRQPVGILGDLQGPRIRIGDLDRPATVATGDDMILAYEGEERPGEFPVTYDRLASDVAVGDRILIDDGLIELVVLDVAASRVRARVIFGGEVKAHKGLNLPGVHVSAPSITDKDREDAAFAAEADLDYLALSFVRRGEDIEALRELVPGHMLVIAKIEKDVALSNIERIIRAADGVMVARGDLGVELPFEEIPIVQKNIIALANRIGKPVITATQMLESMVERPRPTRAEASDVANAILDGTDAVMLSAETAAGAYPRLAVEAMRRIVVETEQHLGGAHQERRPEASGAVPTEQAIAAATVAAVHMLQTPVVVAFTKSGFSARIVSSYRPGVPILALTDQERTYRQLALMWGVVPELVPHCETYDQMMVLAKDAVVRRELASSGDRIVVTAGVPFDVPGTTNILKVERV
ncbi:MAG TPA: pyruvate kinase [Gemmatimonadaceae bacterium]|nr:pyruvate kinase [Gemmatimonadaceae bacterium]